MSTACLTLAITRPQASAACRPASMVSSRVLQTSRLRRTQTLKASFQDVGMLLAAAAEEAVEAVKPGSVEAPTGTIAHPAIHYSGVLARGAIIAGAIVVTLILTAGIPALLNPGTKAAEKIFDRDSKTGRR